MLLQRGNLLAVLSLIKVRLGHVQLGKKDLVGDESKMYLFLCVCLILDSDKAKYNETQGNVRPGHNILNSVGVFQISESSTYFLDIAIRTVPPLLLQEPKCCPRQGLVKHSKMF